MPVPAYARRLLSRYAPDAYVGLVVRVIAAAERTSEDDVERTPEHFLGAAWAPPARVLSRWPEVVVIGSPLADRAIAELFVHLPPEARLYLADRDQADAALAAEILRLGDRNLEPYQRDALDAFIAGERERERARVRSAYTDRDAGFERFRAVLTVGPRRAAR